MDQSSSLWPRMYAVIRVIDNSSTELSIPEIVFTALTKADIECHLVNQDNLVVDISYLQNIHGSTESAVSQLQHLLNKLVSPLDYSLGISSELLLAFHAAQIVPAGQEKWILPRELEGELENVPVSALIVLNRNMPEFFLSCGKKYCSQLKYFGKQFLCRRFSSAGESLWYLLRGKSRQFPKQEQRPDGDMLWRLALPVRTRSRRALSAHLWNLYLTVGRNLDQLDRQAEQIKVHYRAPDGSVNFKAPTRLASRFRQRRQLSENLKELDVKSEGITHLQIIASGLRHPAGQLDLF